MNDIKVANSSKFTFIGLNLELINTKKINFFNSLKLKGISAPFWFRDVFVNTIGYRESEKALQLGLLYSPEEALKIKLIDEICAPQDLLAKAEQQMIAWSKIPSN